MLRIKALLVGLVAAVVVFGAAAPAGALTQDDSTVHGCDITASAQSVRGIDLSRWTVAQLSGADTPACGELGVHWTVHTNDNGVARTDTTAVDLTQGIMPGDRFVYYAAQRGTFRYAQGTISWCAAGGTSCTTRTQTRITIYKGGNILYG
jgi:hypothetical protein